VTLKVSPPHGSTWGGGGGLRELVPTVQRVGPRPYLLSEWAKTWNVFCGKTEAEPVSVKGLCLAFCLQDLAMVDRSYLLVGWMCNLDAHYDRVARLQD
jgi:hypothetical protein